MYTIPITIEQGVLRLPPNAKLPPDTHRAVLIVGDDLHPNDDLDSNEFTLAALRDNPSLAFLEHEPDLYSIEDVRRENRNTR
jgi:hypothetical protein